MMNEEQATRAPVLMVEDDKADAYLVRLAFADAGLAVELSHVSDGIEALEYLRQGRRPRPCLILLDLNMPRMDGWGFLTEIKADAELRAIPVVILSTSDSPEYMARSRGMGAADYIVKPMDIEELTAAVRGLTRFWEQPAGGGF